MRTIAIAGAGAEGLRTELAPATDGLLDLAFVVPTAPTVAGVVDQVLATIDDDERVFVFGHSMNGSLAFAVASTRRRGRPRPLVRQR